MDEMTKKIELDNSSNVTDDEKMKLVSKLKEETGFGMMDCKKALNNSNLKLDGAKIWLVKFRNKSGIMFD